MADDDATFFTELSTLLGTPVPDADERAAVLDLTRVVAHGSERRFGPLTAYVLALTMGADDDPAARAATVRRAIEALEPRLDESG